MTATPMNLFQLHVHIDTKAYANADEGQFN
jgi:hypothetical protein